MSADSPRPADPKDLQALLGDVERHDKAAQPGPWYYVHGYGFNVHSLLRGDGERTPDVDFVCFARTALPQLAAAVRELAKQNEAMAKDGERLERGPMSERERVPMTDSLQRERVSYAAVLKRVAKRHD